MSSIDHRRAALLQSLRRHLRRQALSGAPSQSTQRGGLLAMWLARLKHAGSASLALVAASAVHPDTAAWRSARPVTPASRHRHSQPDRHQWTDLSSAACSASSTGIALVSLYSPAEIHSRGSALLMDIQKKRQALIKAASLADTRAGR